jgi:hypothetical protein
MLRLNGLPIRFRRDLISFFEVPEHYIKFFTGIDKIQYGLMVRADLFPGRLIFLYFAPPLKEAP